ncbi:MAG: undecaprenyl-phosphate glucose phosphotransferase [Muribaculaceae bacterium]|nr:undecaprenyl-phosphate glucose phosphotransferase [Muribaculaceae bacterium]
MTTPSGRGKYIRYIFNIGDVAIVNLLFWLTLLVFPQITCNHSELRQLWLLVNVSVLPAIYMLKGHQVEQRVIYMDIVMRKALVAVLIHALIFLSLIGFLDITLMPVKAYIFYYSLMLVAWVGFRVIAHFVLKLYRKRGYNFSVAVIVGTGPNAMRLYNEIEKDLSYGFRVDAFFGDDPTADIPGGVKYLPLSSLEQYLDKHKVDDIYYTLSGHSERLNKVAKLADDHVANLYYVPQIPSTFLRRLMLHSVGSVPVLSVLRNPLANPLNRALKRMFDIVFSSIFLIFYPLIYIPVAIAIKLSSPGPVYFKQERTGYRGKSFLCYKFRTMRVNATADINQATKNDPRKTRVGDFLRRTSIDELPQFINVLKGDMSVVGPRPHMLKHTEDYSLIVDRYMVRHAVKPGITGLAQVKGYRGATDELWKMEKRVEFDVYYIENWTIFLDIKIIIRTIMNAFSGDKNAY